jgi:molybdenum-dependent DNA-binding transcriptional regulator ModE
MEASERVGRRLKLRALHVLETVVRTGSMAKAASQLNVTQPGVSKAISELERALGVRLLDVMCCERRRHDVTGLWRWQQSILRNIRRSNKCVPAVGTIGARATNQPDPAAIPAWHRKI